MVKYITDKNLKNVLDNYYNLLSSMGYVKHDVVQRILLYTFLLDFLEKVGCYMTEDEYDLLSSVHRKLSAGAGCLLPYPVFCNTHDSVIYPTQ